MGYTLAYKDRFYSLAENMPKSEPASPHCGDVSFRALSAGINKLQLEVTPEEMRWIFDSATQGAMLLYPEKAQTIMEILLKTIDCPPEFPPESGDCLNYLPYANFLTYEPQNPYNQPDYVPPNYLVPPFFLNDALQYPESLGYENTDVFIDPAGLNIDPINVATLDFPNIVIQVVGAGQIEVDFLAVQQGSFVVVKVGSYPNIADLILSGIVETGVKVIDLNNDNVGVPAESDVVISEEININGAVNEITSVYCVFIPALDDSLIPLRYGGGIRQIGLCGFEGTAAVSIEDVRYNVTTGDLEKRIAGVWSVFATCEQLVACAPSGGGGGGGAAGAKVKVSTFNIVPSNFNTTSTTFVNAATLVIMTKTYSKALVIASNVSINHSGSSGTAVIRLVREGNTGVDANEIASVGSTNKPMSIADRWENIEDGGTSYTLQMKVGSGGTASLTNNTTVIITVIEYQDAADLYVEDVRISGRELQKKIGGVWITVSESLNAILSVIDAQIANIIAVNNTQNSQISSIITVNNTQTANITNLQTRMTTAENNIITAQTDIDALEVAVNGAIAVNNAQNLTLVDYDARLDALEAGAGGSSGWGGYKLGSATDVHLGDFTRYSSPLNTFIDGTNRGWQSVYSFPLNQVTLVIKNAARLGSLTFMRLTVTVLSGAGAEFYADLDGSNLQNFEPNAGGSTNLSVWLKVPNQQSDDITAVVRCTDIGTSFRVVGAAYLFVNFNPFTLGLVP